MNNLKKFFSKSSNLIIGSLAIIIIVLLVILIINSNKNEIIILDTTNACNENVYDGNTKTLTRLISNGKYTVSNNTATNAGEYKVSIKPNKGYAWENNSKNDIVITCKIDKAETNLELSNESLVITNNNQASIKIDTPIEGEINIESDDTKVKVNQKNITKDANTITINITAIKEGDTTVKITFTPKDNNYNPITKVVNISTKSPKKVDIPTNKLCTNRINNGQTQKLVSKTDYDGYTLKGQIEGIKSGSYKIEAVLKSGYIWSDGTKDNKSFTCTITDGKTSLKETRSCKAGDSIFVTPVPDNSFIDSINRTTIKNIIHNESITSVKENSACKDNIFLIGPGGTAMDISADCIFPGQYEIKCLKPGEDIIKFTTNDNKEISYTVKVQNGDNVKLNADGKHKVDGIYCVKDKQITVTVTTYRDGVASNILKSYSVKNTKYATVTKSVTQPKCIGCTNLTVKCVKKGSTSLIIKTKDGTTKSFPIQY